MPALARLIAPAILLALLLSQFAAPPARADHGEWQSREVWIEPVVEERTRQTPGRWVKEKVWVPPRTVTEEVTTVVEVEVEYQVFVSDGHWEFVQVWVEAYENRCETVWKWYQDCSNFWGQCSWVYGPREVCERVDVSYFELQQRWVDTSYWETRTRTEYRQETRTVERVIPGRWETRSRWKQGRTQTYLHEVEPGRWETTQVWVELPHDGEEPATDPGTCRPAGIYKVANNYVRNTQWTDENGTIHYRTITSTKPNPWWAVSLGSVSKGRTSAYDSEAFNGRGQGADGQLLAGRFYRNYLPDGDCFDAVSVVFFQDDTVVSGDLDQPLPPSPTPTPVVDPVPSPTPTPGPAPAPTPAPNPNPNPGPPTAGPPALAPGGDFSFTVVIEGSDAPQGSGRQRIQVLRGAPVEVYLLPSLQPPAGDPAAVVSFRSWRFVSGPNDHPQAPGASGVQGPLEPLRLRLDSLAPAGADWHQLALTARVRVLASDGRTQDFDLPVSLQVAVHYQAIG